MFDGTLIGYKLEVGVMNMRGDNLVWTIVGILAIIALCIFIF